MANLENYINKTLIRYNFRWADIFDNNRPQCIIPLGSVVCLDCDWCPISFLPKVATCSHDILREVPELLGISRGEKLPSFFQMIFIFPFLWCSNLMSFWLVFRNSKILRLGLFLIAFFSLYYILKLGLFGGHGGSRFQGLSYYVFENTFCAFVGLPTKSGTYVY